MIFLVDLSDHSVSETAKANKPKHCRERGKKSIEYSDNWPWEVMLYSGASVLWSLKLPLMIILTNSYAKLFPSTVVVTTTRKGGWTDEWWTFVFQKCYCEHPDGFFKTCKGLLSIDSMRVHITPKHSSHLTLLWTVVLRPSSPVGDVNGGWGAQFHNNRDDGSCNFLGCHEMDRPSMDFRHNWNHSVWIPKDQTAHLNWGWWWVWGQPSTGQSASSSSHIGGII